MLKFNFTFYLFLISILSIYCQNDPRIVLNFDEGWKFKKGPVAGAEKILFKDSDWAFVRVPHDWAIEEGFVRDGDGNTGKLSWKDEGWYRKTFSLDEKYLGKRLYLICDGIMAFPKVYINGHLAGSWDYGYNTFYLEISELILAEKENLIAIHVDTRQHDSRWYPGAGIFRKIQLLAVDPVHVDIWGTYITTPAIKVHYADVKIEMTLNNTRNEDENLTVVQRIFSPADLLVSETEKAIEIKAKSNQIIESLFTIPSPELWNLEEPALYFVRTQIKKGNLVLDSQTDYFGIRKIRFDADHGFYLNDRRVQLKGVNLHHDQGPLGAAFHTRAMERQLEIMKAMGCNAVRNSHNVAAPELLDLCDKMGILVLNEIFDKYDGKADISDTTDFDGFAHRNIKNFVKRDRNHPSVFLWSVGNEIGDVQWDLKGGFRKLKTMINYVRKYDPSRPVTLVCDSEKSAALRHFDFYDVHSWNYGRRYKLARQIEPNKAVIISESASTVSTRGFYEFPLPENKTDFTHSLQVSSYDLNAPWWAEIADDDFMWQQEEEYVAGEFVWTGFDYLGEPTPYTNQWAKENGFSDKNASRSSYFGIVDLCGIPKDRYYLYKSYWKPEDTTIHILPHWNWPERVGKTVPVFVYTNGDCAELFLNGVSQGKRCKDPKSENSTERFRLMWPDVVYEPGELMVNAYKNGKLLGKATMKTAGETAAIRLTPDRNHFKADGSDLSYVLIEAFDANGNPQPLANNELTIHISGPGEIAGVCNGNPQSFEPFKSDEVQLFYGKAMLLIQSTGKAGKIEIRVNSGNLDSGFIELTSK